jgi:hypothetical protein
MIRQFLTVVLPFIAPTIAYIIWVYFRQEREEALAQGRKLPHWQDYPWTWLVTIGAALVAASLIAFGMIFQNTNVDQEYRPAHYEDGKLIPGEFVDKNSDKQQGDKAPE